MLHVKSIGHPPITARPIWLKQSIGTFTLIHTTGNIASSRVLEKALLRHKVARITLDITTQSILYTDARREIMQQRSGGLASSKNLTQRKKRAVILKYDQVWVFWRRKRKSKGAFTINIIV